LAYRGYPWPKAILPGTARNANARRHATITKWLPTFFDGDTRRLWAARLVQVAYLKDRLGETDLRDLAATAALALGPGSGVPPADQPLAHALLHHTAFRHAQAQDEARMRERLQQLATASRPRPKARPKATVPAEVYQLKIALKGAKPPSCTG
jgi:hypothetical protein